ncbi:hypothetical protein CI109_104403 [Kwoniella shandongensis]|uniref:Uncharacterized protein n=1 Tax=Kwoniella shandongensis TaxID=1734106 RepID=A0A5M6C1B2_9TREE|nr:uncharacterized protein CI109_004198 [Kwoniella shandongensis]KAA5527385.1 hypothetical protein CI109_004198 [Kwoniella shandongensis]
MIIPPDPEKDPNIFSPSSSTPSLLNPPSESAYDVDWEDESLPPYERRQRRSRISSSHEGDVFSDENALPRRTSSSPPRLRTLDSVYQHRSHHRASSSSTGSLTPTGILPIHTSSIQDVHPQNISPTTTLNSPHHASTSKIWEGSSSSQDGKSRKRICGILPPLSAESQKRWLKWRRWVQAVMVLVLIGVGLAIGLLVGLEKAAASRRGPGPMPPWMDNEPGGKKAVLWGIGSSANMTYDADRDGPKTSEANLTTCNIFTPFNFSSSPFSTLFTPFPATTLSLASFSFPIVNGTPPSNMFINAHGLGSSGTITFIGTGGAEHLLTSGKEDQILIDVIVRYSGQQKLDDIMQVCQMTRGDGGVGVGLYTPIETDGKVANIYAINPTSITTSHIVIRLPPSAYRSSSAPIYFPSFSFNLDRMSVRFGHTENVAEFGNLLVQTGNGGTNVGYVAAKNATVLARNSYVAGRWNISESLRVNVTDGAIAADVILFDPSTPDHSSAIEPTTDFNNLRRSPHRWTPPPTTDAVAVPNNTATSNSSVHIITTGFFTTEGAVDVRYLRHPPSVALRTITATLQGNVGVHVHPNYVGPFIARTMWGELVIPSPGQIPNLDPKGKERLREVGFGTIEVDPSSNFASIGVNTTMLESSRDTISGVAYWADVGPDGKKVGYESVAQVQEGEEGNENELIVLGAWGDVEVTFDGA